MEAANQGDLSNPAVNPHTPPSTWACYSTTRADTASKANLS